MTLSNKSQILGVQWRNNDSTSVKVAYNDAGVLKRLITARDSDIIDGWVNDGGEIKEYQEPFNSFNHPTPKIR